jgi:hypothetical protein
MRIGIQGAAALRIGKVKAAIQYQDAIARLLGEVGQCLGLY